MPSLRRLSYDLGPHTPVWPGNPALKVTPYTRTGVDGESCTQDVLELLNHLGSHMDGPRHFNPSGLCLHEVSLDQMVFYRPALIDLPKAPGEQVMAADLEPFAALLGTSDALLIRTGSDVLRRRDPQTYAAGGPSVSAQAARYLIDQHPHLKALGLDLISLASPLYGSDGVLAHQYLLGTDARSPYILIIEDLNFSGLEARELLTVYALPLFVSGMDSAPCTVVAHMT
ncbi:cyclase family protein [Deinococcus sp. SM5_A1]|uniref:cyclase family protein n=1 Tax=Deinococcus sp. SM5_A1 TaxID=3379094 RepID=UPI00385A09CA